MSAAIDHLVVMAASLEDGVAWCEARLGVTPGPGGEHPLMGTHNRVLSLASPGFACAYLEIIAVNPGATHERPTGASRWFDMDDAALRERVAQHGPQLIHWVARVPEMEPAVLALEALHIERGAVLQASRGTLRWHITVRGDGQRLFDGCLPTLIQWGIEHPCLAMPASGVTLRSLRATHPRAHALQAAYDAIDLAQVPVSLGPARLTAQLQTPHGLLELHS
ncbi:MAG: VOC family protein [Burkholderiaceae bacterium]|nr:MAG: VOC family protein [Burkholderiaceae bacterium]